MVLAKKKKSNALNHLLLNVVATGKESDTIRNLHDLAFILEKGDKVVYGNELTKKHLTGTIYLVEETDTGISESYVGKLVSFNKKESIATVTPSGNYLITEEKKIKPNHIYIVVKEN